jgi:Tol biopolymer transport system component
MPEIGQTISHYRIIEKLGQGGMGEVYRARDLKLDRDVAIKVLPKAFAQDPDALARFQREAKAVASLSHPNILAIHEFGSEQGLSFAATELLEGVTLRERITSGPLPLRKTLEYAVQITHGLASAHDRGVTHRDLKPENIFVTSDGIVKILDFGLAKQQPVTPPDDSSKSPTLDTDPLTVLGTIGYMAPEQVKGQPADRRSDIFSLGCVLYEMLSGKRAFARETAAETMVAILKEDPLSLDAQGSSGSSTSTVTPAFARIVNHCLEKDANERFQSARDLAFDLQALLNSPSSASSPAADVRRLRPAVWLVMAGLVVGAALLTFYAGDRFAARRSEALRIPQCDVKQLTFQPGVEQDPCLSPDGTSFAFVAGKPGNLDIYLQRVDGQNPIKLTKGCDKDDHDPSFSPTGDRIAYRSECGVPGIYIMGATGESAHRLTDFGFSPSWSPDGRQIVVATEDRPQPFDASSRSELLIVDMDTGAKRMLFEGDSASPSWSPHGKRIAFWRQLNGQRDILTIPASRMNGEKPVPVTDDADVDWDPFWSPDGRYLYYGSGRGGSMNLWRIAIDESTGKMQSLPEPLTLPAPWCGQFSISRDGSRTIYRNLTTTSTFYRIGFDPVKERVLGSEATILGISLDVVQPDLSPDGQWIAFATVESHGDIFMMRPDGSDLKHLTDDVYRDRRPVFSPTDTRIAFYSNRGGGYGIWTIQRDGSEPTKVWQDFPSTVEWPVWSPDGKALVFDDNNGKNYFLELSGSPDDRRPQLLPPAGRTFRGVSWSPDRQFLAGRMDAQRVEDRGIGIYDFGTKRYERLTSGSTPLWLRDSRRLIYIDKGSLWLYDIIKKSSRVILDSAENPSITGFAISSDGKTIYFVRTVSEGDIWLATLR